MIELENEKLTLFLVGYLAGVVYSQNKPKDHQQYKLMIENKILNEATLQKIYVWTAEKIYEYELPYTELLEKTSLRLLKPIDLSKTELGYYYTLGFTYDKKRKLKIKED